MRIEPRRARIALISGFGAIVLAARLYGFHIERPGLAGTLAIAAMVALLIGGAIALYIGFTSLNWANLRRRRRDRNRR